MTRITDRLGLLVSSPTEPAAPDRKFSDYEAGKRRRYELLFAVNGGAYALAIWAAGEDRNSEFEIGALTQDNIAFGMAAFAAIMCLDLFAFGLRYQAFFGVPGKIIVIAISALLMGGWLLAAGAIPPPEASVFGLAKALKWPVGVSLAMSILACVLAKPEHPFDKPRKKGEEPPD